MLVVLPCSISCLHAAGHEHGLHVALGLREVEQLPAVGVAAHLDEPLASCCSGRSRATGRGCRRAGRGSLSAAATTPSARSRELAAASSCRAALSSALGVAAVASVRCGFLAMRCQSHEFADGRARHSFESRESRLRVDASASSRFALRVCVVGRSAASRCFGSAARRSARSRRNPRPPPRSAGRGRRAPRRPRRSCVLGHRRAAARRACRGRRR